MSSNRSITRPRTLKRRMVGSLAVAVTAAIVLIPASPAAAHHGWDGFDTDRLIYIAGTVSSDGSWGEPHSYFDVALEAELPSDTPELTIPEELRNPEDSARVNAAVSYSGPQEELEVIIAPPAWSGRWGLDRALEEGEQFQAVGYINRTDDAMFRPVVFWYAADATPVNQVLGNTLPVRAPLPDGAAGPSSASSDTSEVSVAPDPLETPAAEAGNEAGGDGAGTWGTWVAFVVTVVVAVGGGFFYLRRRTRDS